MDHSLRAQTVRDSSLTKPLKHTNGKLPQRKLPTALWSQLAKLLNLCLNRALCAFERKPRLTSLAEERTAYSYDWMHVLVDVHELVGGRVGVVVVDGDVLRERDVAFATLHYKVCTSRKGSAKTYSPAHKIRTPNSNVESRIC